MGTSSKFVHFLPLLLLLPFLLVAADVEEFVAEAGDEVQLSCPVKTSECGNYHSLKWYRDSTRVFVYSPIAGFKNAEDILMDRCLDMSQASLGSDCPRGNLEEGDEEIGLTVGPIRMEDGGEYRCEITYLDVSSDCPLVHFSNLRTIAPPDYQRISLSPGGEDMAEQVVGPYAAGTEATFTCESGGGKPAPTITWVFGEDEAEGEVEEEIVEEEGKITSTLTIMLVREHSGSDLTCKVSHEALDEDLVTKMQVDVNIAVETVELESLEGQEDEEMEVVCRATKSRPEAVITWALPDHLEFSEETEVELLDDDTFDTVSTIRFTPTAKDDGVSVNCQAVNEVMEDPLETTEEITVLFAPRVSIDEGGQSVFAGEEAVIECQVKANPDNLTRLEWIKDDSPLVEDDRFIVEELTLTITGVRAEDAGQYRCVAENSIGEAESEESHPLEVFYPPSMEVHISPEDPVAEDDEVDVELHCNLLDGHPSLLHSVYWYRDGQPFRVTPDPEVCEDGWTGASLEPSESEWVHLDLENDTIEEEDPCSDDPSLLVLPTVTRENVGHYSCAGRNSAGEGEQSEGIFLDVQYPPDVAEVVLEDEPVKGEEVQLSCFLEDPGNPLATEFLWKKNGEELEETSSNLTVASLVVADNGNYSCAGRNPIGIGESDLIFLDIAAPPHMLEGLSEETVVVSGNEVALTCHLECSPDCALEWLIDGIPLEDGFVMEEDEVEHNISEEVMEEDVESNQFSSILSTLTWHQLRNVEEDFNITCRAKVYEEEEDLVFSTTSVSVHYLPGPSDLIIEEGSDLTKGNNALLSCLLEDFGKPEVTEYRWTKDGEDLEEVSSMLNLTSLGVASEGNYTCAGVNYLGAGEPQSLILDIAAPPHLIDGPSEFTGVVVGEEASLSCHVECSPLCVIEWLVDGDLVEDETASEDEEGGSGDELLSIGGYAVQMEEMEEDEENNQFSSVVSTISWKQLLHIDGNITFACRVQGYDMDAVDVESSGLEDGFIVDIEELDSFDPIIAFTTVMIEYAPESPMITSEMDCSASNKLGCEVLELEEGTEGAALDCSSSALPAADITWLKGGQEVANGGQFVFPDPLHRDSAGDYTCRASNVHGTVETTMTFSVVYSPSCTVTHSVEGADLLLKCTADANPEAELSWSLRDTPLEGKAGDGRENQQTSILRLEISDNSTGLYYCHASNSLGESSCKLELTESMLTAGLSEFELRIIIIVCIVVGVLLIIVFLCYLCHRRNNKGNKAGPAAGKGKSSAGKDLEKGNGNHQPSADKSFYENLPFHGLKSPPKQVLNPKSDDHLDYADADYKDLYAEGPVGYKAASKQAKEGKRL